MILESWEKVNMGTSKNCFVRRGQTPKAAETSKIVYYLQNIR